MNPKKSFDSVKENKEGTIHTCHGVAYTEQSSETGGGSVILVFHKPSDYAQLFQINLHYQKSI